MVDNLAHVDAELAQRVAAPLGIDPPNAAAAAARRGFRKAPFAVDVQPSPALSMATSVDDSIATRCVAILVADGVDGIAVDAVKQTLMTAGAQCKVVAAALGSVATASGARLAVDCTFGNTPSIAFDAVFLPALGGAPLTTHGDAVHFVLEAYKHCKAIAAAGSGAALLGSQGVSMPTEAGVTQPLGGVVLCGAGQLPGDFAAAFIGAIGQHRHWSRSNVDAVPA